MITYNIIDTEYLDPLHSVSKSGKLRRDYIDKIFNFNEDFDLVKVYTIKLLTYDLIIEEGIVSLNLTGEIRMKIKYLISEQEQQIPKERNILLKFGYCNLKGGNGNQIQHDFSFMSLDGNNCNDLLIDELHVDSDSISNVELRVILIFSAFYKYLCENTKVDYYEGKNKWLKVLGQDIIGKGLTSEVAFNMFSVGSQNVIAKSFRENEDNTTQKALETSLEDINIYPKPDQGDINDILLDGAFRISYK